MASNSKPASFSGHQNLLAITTDLIRQKAVDSRDNPRRRVILSLHESDDAPLHRMLNALQPGSYVRPHRHLTPPKAEGVVLLAGAVGFVAFSEDGQPDEDQLVHISHQKGVVGVDFRAGLWHTLIALEPDSVIYEVKPGPYNAATDKEFAPWSPEEDTPEAALLLSELESLFR